MTLRARCASVVSFFGGNWFHRFRIGVWVVLLWPTLTIWSESIPYVIFLSWYANFIGDVSAYFASRAEKAAKEKL